MSGNIREAITKHHGEIYRLYEHENRSYQYIANIYGVSRERIRQIINKMGGTPRREKIQQRNRSIIQVTENEGLETAIAKHDIPEQIIRRIAGDLNNTSIRKQWIKNVIEPAVLSVKDGMSVRQAAKKFGTTEVTLAKYCAEADAHSRHGPHREMSERVKAISVMLEHDFSFDEMAKVISKQEKVSIKGKSLAIWYQKNKHLFGAS